MDRRNVWGDKMKKSYRRKQNIGRICPNCKSILKPVAYRGKNNATIRIEGVWYCIKEKRMFKTTLDEINLEVKNEEIKWIRNK